MKPNIVLTGIKPTGEVHLGNYVGSIRPSLEMTQTNTSYLFIADSHALTVLASAKKIKESTQNVAAAWLACGLNPKKTIFYRQSDIPELFEFYWILSCITPKGLMNRAHSYKSKITLNEKKDDVNIDDGIYMGLYSYPVLMAADILLFSAHQVPVGSDQMQHLEMTRDIAQKFNHIYKTKLLTIPMACQSKQNMTLGIDGQKMSKSYQNHIPLFCDSNKLLKLVMKIKTDSSDPMQPKSTENCIIFGLYKHFATTQEISALKKKYQEGIGWREAKEHLFEKIESFFKDKQELYESYRNNYIEIDKILKEGKEKARAVAIPFLKEIKKVIGCS